MIRLLHHTPTRLVAALACVAASAIGCADDAKSFIILHNILPSVEDGEIPGEFVCKLDSSLGAMSASSGILDLERPQSFTFSPTLRSGLAEDPNSVTRRHIALRGADVILMAGPSARSQMLIASVSEENLRRTVPTSGTLAPGDTLLATTYPLIDADQARLLASNPLADEAVQIIARTQMFGVVDGNDVESDSFDYPITLCKDCVFDPLDRLYDVDGNPLPDTQGREYSTGCFGDQYP